MSGICWRLVDIVSRVLEPDERAAVWGDFAESGDTAGQALRGVLGLVARRQAALWTHWRAWLALMGLVVPLGLLLCLVSRRTADGSAIRLWFYANNWDWSFLTSAAFRHGFATTLEALFAEYLTLFCGSWTCGFVLGSVSRGGLPADGVLFALVLLLGELLGIPPRHFGYALFYRARDFPNNAAVFELTFYRVIFPLIVQLALVLFPSVWGMRQALSAAGLRPLVRTVIWIVATAALAVVAIRAGLLPDLYSHRGSSISSHARLLQLAVYWPVGYLVIRAIEPRWRGRIASL
jgi:hypothetical protein